MEEVLEAPYANWHGGLRFIMCGFKGIVLWFACIDVLKAYSFVVNLRFPSKDSSQTALITAVENSAKLNESETGHKYKMVKGPVQVLHCKTKFSESVNSEYKEKRY